MNEILTQEKSIYIQISEMIENDILRDILCEEERVPSTNELAKLYAINPATAAKGINILVEAGIVYKKRGIGMFVAKGAKEVIQKKRKDAFYQDYIASMLAEAQSLGITKRFFRNYPLLLLYPMYLNFASSNCLPHLPYIVRFIIFNLLLVPSTNPLL